MLAKILTFSAHRSRKKNTETQFGESRKVAFILSQQRGEASRLLPQELCPLHEESRGFYRARACSQVMRNKGDQENSEQGLNIPSHFTLTAPNSTCLQLSLFLYPLTLQELRFTFFSFDSLLNTPPIWCLPLQHPSPCSYIWERRPQKHRTARLNYWVTDARL